MIGSDRRSTIRTTNQRWVRIKPCPIGTDSRLNLFQAINCLDFGELSRVATIILVPPGQSPTTPFGTKPDKPLRDELETHPAAARRPLRIPNPLGGCNSDLAQYSITPSLRVAASEDSLPRRRLGEGGRTRTAARLSSPKSCPTKLVFCRLQTPMASEAGKTRRLVSTFNPLRGCNSGKALLIGLTRLFCKQQRSSAW